MSEWDQFAVDQEAAPPAAEPAAEPSYTSGIGTVFGLNPDGSVDRQDNGKGYYGFNTRDPGLVGVSLPRSVLREKFGHEDNAAGQVVEVVNPGTKKVVRAQLVDVGPAEWTGNALDLTYGAMKAVGATGKDELQYRFVNNEEPQQAQANPWDQFQRDEPASPAASDSGGWDQFARDDGAVTPEQQQHLDAAIASQSIFGMTSPLGATLALGTGGVTLPHDTQEYGDLGPITEEQTPTQGTPMTAGQVVSAGWEAANAPLGGIGQLWNKEGKLFPRPEGKGFIAGVERGAINVGESFLSPLSVTSLGALSAVSPAVQKIVGALFAAPMVKALPGQIIEAKEALQSGDMGTFGEKLVEGGTGALMATTIMGHTPRSAGKAERVAAEKLKPQFDYETGVVRTTEGVAKVTPEGARPLTETEKTSLQSLSKKVEPITSDLVAERERLIAEGKDTTHPEVKELDDLIKLAEQPEIPTAAEVEATVESEVTTPEPTTPAPKSRITGPAVRTAEGIREGKLGDTHAELKLQAAQEGLDFTEGEHIFRNAEGRELSRTEAWEAAKENGQLTEEGLRKADRKNADGTPRIPELESQDLIVDLPNAARKLELEEVGPETYERIEDEALLDDHVAYKDPETNQIFQIPKDATQADLVEILGAVRGEETTVRKRAELERRTEEVTSRGIEPTELPTTAESKLPGLSARKPKSEPVTSADHSVWNDPDYLTQKAQQIKDRLAPGNYKPKTAAQRMSEYGETAAEAQRNAAAEVTALRASINKLEAQAAKLYLARKEAKMTLRSKESGSTILPDILIDAGRTFYRKGMEFVEWSKRVVSNLGAKIKPHLEAIWKKINQGPFLKQAAEVGAAGTGNKFSKVQQSLDASVAKAQVITDRLVEKAKTLGASEMAKQVRIADRWMAADYHRARKELLEFAKDLPLKERAKFTTAITDALKRVPVLTKDPSVIFRRAEKVKDRITAAVYEVQRKDVIGKIERAFEKNEETKSITVPEKQAIRARKAAFGKLKDRMPLDLLEAMQDNLKNIRERGKDLFILDEVMKEQVVKATLREITTQGVRKIDTPEQARLALGETETWFQRQIAQIGRAPELLKHFNLALTPFDWLVQTFDKKAGGAIRRTMKLPVDVLYGEWMDSVETPKRELADIGRKHNLKAGNFDRIYAHAELRQPGGRENLEALGYTPKELARVRRFKNLSKGEQEWLTKADQINNDLFPKVQQVLENYFHQEIEKVDGYFPRQRDWEHYNTLSIEEGRFAKSYNKTSPAKGHTISRTGAITKNKTNAQEIMFKHIDDALYHIKLGPEIRRLADVVKKQEFADSVGTMGQKVFSDWVDVLSRNGQQGSGKIAILDFFRKNVGMATLAFRLTTTALQPLSLIQGMAVVSPKNMGRALTMMGSKANREFVLKNFPEIRQRVGDDPAYNYSGPSVRDAFARAGFKGISMLDRFAAMTTGLGAYMDALPPGAKLDLATPNPKAIQAAQLAVRKTQSSSYPKDLPLALSRGNFTGNMSVDKAIFQFQNFMISKWALTKNGALQLGIEEKSARAGARIFTFIALGVIAEELTREGIKRAISATLGATERQKQQDKKDKKAGKTLALKMAEKAAVDMVTSVPLVSNASGMIQYEGSGIPVLDVLGKTLVSGTKATIAKKPSTRIKEAINAGQGAGALFGIPTGQALDLVKQGVDSNKAAIDPSTSRW